MENTPLILTQTGFIVLTIVMYALAFKELRKAIFLTSWDEKKKSTVFNRAVIVTIGWTLVISVLGLIGFFQDFSTFPPRFMILLVFPLITLLFSTFSGKTTEILKQIPMLNIVRLQVFRLFVEILLWMLFIQNVLPVQMTFEGRNIDVVVGVTAPFAAYFFSKNRTVMILWNVISLGILMNIIIVAILSLPTPFRVFMNEPTNTILTHFPFIWLPGLLVPMAYGLHFMAMRKLYQERK
ncbi:MAG: hypothetical protein HOP08_19110 [Cyclobacteriaceae bacterium]|nr:hypothetical protein [Cyclobacteriaceae bacterium]